MGRMDQPVLPPVISLRGIERDGKRPARRQKWQPFTSGSRRRPLLILRIIWNAWDGCSSLAPDSDFAGLSAAKISTGSPSWSVPEKMSSVKRTGPAESIHENHTDARVALGWIGRFGVQCRCRTQHQSHRRHHRPARNLERDRKSVV